MGSCLALTDDLFSMYYVAGHLRSWIFADIITVVLYEDHTGNTVPAILYRGYISIYGSIPWLCPPRERNRQADGQTESDGGRNLLDLKFKILYYTHIYISSERTDFLLIFFSTWEHPPIHVFLPSVRRPLILELQLHFFPRGPKKEQKLRGK